VAALGVLDSWGRVAATVTGGWLPGGAPLCPIYQLGGANGEQRPFSPGQSSGVFRGECGPE